jgi:predicted nuclease of restriction endonuclease-like (RecB) superfamily
MVNNPKKTNKKSGTQQTDASLWSGIRALILEARRTVARGVNAALVWTNFEIGRRIVEHEQRGKVRAEYAEETLKALSRKLTAEFGRGYSVDNLQRMRMFYLMYQKYEKASRISGEEILQTASVKSEQLQSQVPKQIVHALSAQSSSPGKYATASRNSGPEIWQTVSAKFQHVEKSETLLRKSPTVFPLSWSHYVFLMGIEDENERRFYEIESDNQNWSLRELRRQFSSSLYERLALSRDKKKVGDLGKQGQIVEKPEDLMKDPYVLEFLGLKEESAYSETDLETAIINRIEHFLLELGKGFLFEARQKRFTFDDKHFRVDLVFYNRILRCYVLIDLKIGELTHQDLGQMQMYVNYYDRFVKMSDESRTVGIILCKRKNDSLVKITLPEHSRIFARKYQLYLPTKAQLRAQLDEKA